MAYATIILEKQAPLATLTLNRPERLNAVNDQMFAELNAALEEVAADRQVRVLVLTGAGRAFCAAADIKDERQGGDKLFSRRSPYEGFDFVRTGGQAVTRSLQALPQPTIAMVNGLAIGDGFDWVLACDIRIGCERSRFMNAFVQMGLAGATGGTWLAPKIMGINRALELWYTGDWLEPEEAYRIGVLNRLVRSDELQGATMTLARKIADRAPVAQRLVKELMYRGMNENLEQHLTAAAAATVFTITTEDHREALEAYIGKRPAAFKGR